MWFWNERRGLSSFRDSKGNVLDGELNQDIEQLPGSEESDSEESVSEDQGSEEPVTDPIEIKLLEDSTADSILDDHLLDLSFYTSEEVNDSIIPIIEEVEEEDDSSVIEGTSVVKTLSARAMDVITAANGLKTVIGDINNAFIQT